MSQGEVHSGSASQVFAFEALSDSCPMGIIKKDMKMDDFSLSNRKTI